MSKSKVAVLTLILVLTIVGFSLGQVVNAAISSPGAASDPLVTKSYVDNEVSRLQNQIESLKAEVEELKHE